ncbi:hypothetical protein Tco_0012184 [Tanacetum coccineum]
MGQNHQRAGYQAADQGNSVNNKFAKALNLGNNRLDYTHKLNPLLATDAFNHLHIIFAKGRESAPAKPHHVIAQGSSRKDIAHLAQQRLKVNPKWFKCDIPKQCESEQAFMSVQPRSINDKWLSAEAGNITSGHGPQCSVRRLNKAVQALRSAMSNGCLLNNKHSGPGYLSSVHSRARHGVINLRLPYEVADQKVTGGRHTSPDTILFTFTYPTPRTRAAIAQRRATRHLPPIFFFSTTPIWDPTIGYLLLSPRPGCEVGESSDAAAARQLGPTMARRVDCSYVDTVETRVRDTERRMMATLEVVNLRVSYQVDVRSRESSEFYSRHHDAQKDRAAVRAEIEVLRRERLTYEQESIQTRQDFAKSKAYSRALEARITVLETQARRHEWQR